MLKLTPTHVQVAVLRTKDLIVKGKNGTNDAFIIFSLGKQKFQSSTKEKVADQVLEWNEGCDIPIPSTESNKSEVVLKVLHKASIGDKFLGRLALPLSQFDVTAKARPTWYPLKPKPGSEKDTKYRGEIEVRISFLIKSTAGSNSSNDLASKTKQKDGFRSSLGSILSLGKKKKKKEKEKSGYNSSSKESLSASKDSLRYGSTSSRIHLNNNLPVINDDPGVISEEEDDVPLALKIDDAIKNSNAPVSASVPDQLNTSLSSLPTTPRSIPKSGFRDEFEQNVVAKQSGGMPTPTTAQRNNYDKSPIPSSPKPKRFQLPSVIVEEEVSPSSSAIHEALTAPPTPEPQPKLTVSVSMSNLMEASSGKGGVKKTLKAIFTSPKHLSVDNIYNTAEAGSANSSIGSAQSQKSTGFGFMKRVPSLRELKIPKEMFKQYERKSKEELVAMIVNLHNTVDSQKQKISDLEDYIDKLLLRVLDNMPSLLKNGGSVRVRD